tara:strand:+ start:2529 stop:2708 length:180 start_codon:yes stop_codon:yes gene_type:complete
METTIKKGQKVKYLKQFMFGKESLINAKVVMVNNNKVLLDNGDEFYAVSNWSMYYTIVK